MTRKGWLIALQVLGGLPLLTYPVAVVFSLVSFGAMKTWWQTAFMVGIVSYPVVLGLLYSLSWKALRKGRFGLAMALSTPPVIPMVAVGGFLVFGMAWEILTSKGRQQASDAEWAVAEDLRLVMGRELAYRARNHGSFGELACLAEPQGCLPEYSGPPFIDKSLAAAERNGYAWRFHPGPSSAGSPHSLTSFAYTAVPLTRGRKAAYCGDDTGQLWRMAGGGEPVVVGGRCGSGEEVGTPIPPLAVPRRPSGLVSKEDAAARSRAPATAKLSRDKAMRRLEELGHRQVDAPSLVVAAFEGKTEAVELFLMAGVPIDTPRYSLPPIVGATALFAAVKSGYLDTAARLVKAGANVNVKDLSNPSSSDAGQTPLIVLSQYCDETALVSAVIGAGADVNARTRGDWTALQAAEKGHCPEIAGLLRKAGATH